MRKVNLSYVFLFVFDLTINGENLTIQRRVFVMNIRVKMREKRKRHEGAQQIKWWLFKGEKKNIFKHKFF